MDLQPGQHSNYICVASEIWKRERSEFKRRNRNLEASLGRRNVERREGKADSLPLQTETQGRESRGAEPAREPGKDQERHQEEGKEAIRTNATRAGA